jgi:CheY-like chemotaxis protein
MDKTSPIVLVESNAQDSALIIDVLRTLGMTREIRCLEDGDELLDYLMRQRERPYLTIVNINLPGTDGREIKKRINATPELRLKATPFLFFTRTYSKAEADEAYSLGAQGYFQKDGSRKAMEVMLKTILEYWGLSEHPDPRRFGR